MKFGTGSNTEGTQKYARVKVQNYIRTSKHIYKLVVCLSTNGERALNYTIVKRLILTTNTQAKVEYLN